MRLSDDDHGVDLEVDVIASTDKAILISVDGDEYWLPRSQVHPDSELDENTETGDSGIITVTSWWAEKEGL